MKIILFSHPLFLEHQSMPRYANWLANGMRARGHEVSIIYPDAVTYKWNIFQKFRKWLGYIDQYILFPINIKSKLRHMPEDTLFVFSDHALGPWVPLVSNRKHIVHCHDFLAQKSAMGQIPQNPTGKFGKLYQQYIRNGFRQAKNFISISHKTQTELHEFLGDRDPNISEVVYNGLNQKFDLQNVEDCRKEVGSFTHTNLTSGYFLHVGGNLWYKNRKGVLLIYDAWRKLNPSSYVRLLMLGAAPEDDLLSTYNNCTFKSDIHFVIGANDDLLKKAYCGAVMMLFPSIAEGFGWPIAEAMASGCPVLTTDAVPMSEVAGTAALLIEQIPFDDNGLLEWATAAAVKIDLVLSSKEATGSLIAKGFENVKRFDSDKALDAIENIYMQLYKTQ